MGKRWRGGIELANQVIDTLENDAPQFQLLYPDNMPLKQKIETIAQEIYGAKGVTYNANAQEMLTKIEDMGFVHFLFVWQKRNILYQMIPHYLVARLILPLISGKCMSVLVQALLLH